MSIVWVALGSAIGGASRFWIGGLITARAGDSFPWGTLLVNITGCFLIGLIAAPYESGFLANQTWRTFATVGILGGYTTFSAFSLQALTLAENGQWDRAALYVGASVALCLAGVWLGQFAGMSLAR